MEKNPSAAEIINYFSQWNLNSESREYISNHARRYQYLLTDINQLIEQNPIKTILDVGCAYQTELMRKIYPDIKIDTIGFADSRFQARTGDQHIEYDLNLAQTGAFPQINQYDLVVLAEVLEHLYTAPSIIFNFLDRIIAPGGFLIVQTPNAVGLPKRLRMLFGSHPYEMLREDMKNPGHYREYTLPELIELGQSQHFRVIKTVVNNDFRSSTLSNNFYNLVSLFLPASLKRGITIIYQKSGHPN